MDSVFSSPLLIIINSQLSSSIPFPEKVQNLHALNVNASLVAIFAFQLQASYCFGAVPDPAHLNKAAVTRLFFLP